MSRIRIDGETAHPKEIITHDVINAVIGRLMAIKETLQAIEADLAAFQKRYGYSDDEFRIMFTRGDLGDEADFFAWDGSIRLREKMVEEDAILREVL
jgi:hypothetical protein